MIVIFNPKTKKVSHIFDEKDNSYTTDAIISQNKLYSQYYASMQQGLAINNIQYGSASTGTNSQLYHSQQLGALSQQNANYSGIIQNILSRFIRRYF